MRVRFDSLFILFDLGEKKCPRLYDLGQFLQAAALRVKRRSVA